MCIINLISGRKALRLVFSFITLLVLSLFVVSLVNRPPDIDDAWLGEHAYWQSKLGYVKSDLMHGITFQEVRFLCHHKLLTLQGAGFIKVFGFSLNTIRIIPLLYLLIFAVIYFFYAYRKVLSPLTFWFSLILLLSNALILQYSYVFRPEIPLMTLGFISYIFLDKALQPNNQRLFYPILSGIFAGLCIATHLNGIIFPIAGFLIFVFNKRYLQSLLFGISVIPPALIYFYDFTEKYGFHFWLYQLNETPSHDRITHLPYGLGYLSNLANEHMRFFHSPVEISLSILFIFCIILLFKYLKHYRNLLLYTIFLMVSLAILSVHKSTKYIIIYLPYIILLISISLEKIFDVKNQTPGSNGRISITRIQRISILLVMIYLSINIMSGIRMALMKYDSGSDMALINSYVPEPGIRKNIIVPMRFFFFTAQCFNHIHSELSYSEMQKDNSAIYQDGFLRLAGIQKIDYIFLSDQFISKFGMDKMSSAKIEENNYKLLLKNKNMIILKKLPSLEN